MSVRLPLLVAFVLALLAPAAHAFAGHNGAIVYGWSSSEEPELGPPFRYERAIRTIAPAGGTPFTARGCVSNENGPLTGDCAVPVYADPAASPNGTRLLFDAGPTIALMDVDGESFRLLPGHTADDGDPAWGPKGTAYAFAGDGAIWISGLFSDRARQLAVGSDPAWSVTNKIAFVGSDGIWVKGRFGRGLRHVSAKGSAPAWSPRGSKLAFVKGGSVYVYDVATRRTTRAWKDAGATDLAWSPNGRRFVVHVFDGGVWTARTNGTQARQVVAGGVNGTSAFDANGVDWIATH
jgi:Tol biopolymer transport system component